LADAHYLVFRKCRKERKKEEERKRSVGNKNGKEEREMKRKGGNYEERKKEIFVNLMFIGPCIILVVE